MSNIWKHRWARAGLVGLALALFGCGGGGSVGGVSQGAATFTVTGKTSLNGAGLAGVTLTISGLATPVTTDANGRFSANLADGSYTITPSLAGYSFFPSRQTMTVAGGSISVPEFTASATASSFTVSGRVLAPGGAGLAGVQVALSGSGGGSAVTDQTGAYSFTGVPSGSSIVTPTLSGYLFTPLSQVVTVTNADVAVPDITSTLAAPASYTISGAVRLNGTGLAGVTVAITGAGAGSLITGTDGTFAFVGVRNGSYTLTPSITGYSFSPTSLSVTVNGASQSGENFTAALPAGGSITITF